MALRDDLDEAERRIAEHPAFQEHRRIDAFGRTLLAVFLPNQRELLALVNQASTDPEIAFELVQNVHPPTVREQFHAQTIQRLHNYVAATMTLVDHSRRLIEGRSGSVDGFIERKAAVIANYEVPFVQDLRNFMLHRSLPFLAHTLKMDHPNTDQATMSSEVELNTAELKSFKNWTPASKAYLDDHPEAVQVRPLVAKHGHLLFSLNAWLYRSLGEANAPGLEEVNRLVVERNAILIGGDLDQARAMTDRWSATRGYPESPGGVLP